MVPAELEAFGTELEAPACAARRPPCRPCPPCRSQPHAPPRSVVGLIVGAVVGRKLQRNHISARRTVYSLGCSLDPVPQDGWAQRWLQSWSQRVYVLSFVKSFLKKSSTFDEGRETFYTSLAVAAMIEPSAQLLQPDIHQT